MTVPRATFVMTLPEGASAEIVTSTVTDELAVSANDAMSTMTHLQAPLNAPTEDAENTVLAGTGTRS
ncbi:hypothetical protein D3C83_291440 [compost metagenome]